jgi:hypothetical protein
VAGTATGRRSAPALVKHPAWLANERVPYTARRCVGRRFQIS